MLLSILGFFTGLSGPISSVINNITDLKKMRAKADSDKELQNINRQIEEAHDKRAVLVAEAGHRIAGLLNACMRVAIAAPAAIILWKLAYDKVVGSWYGCTGTIPKAMAETCKVFRTDPLGPELAALIIAVIGFYLVVTWKK